MKVIRALKTFPLVNGAKGPAVSGNAAVMIEPRRQLRLDPPKLVHPPTAAVPADFLGGPTFVAFLRDGFVDPATGVAFTADRQLVRETVMVERIADEIAEAFPHLAFDKAARLEGDGPAFVVSNQRAENYCRFLLDVAAKPYVFERAAAFHGIAARDRHYIAPRPVPKSFHYWGFEAIGVEPAPLMDAPLLRGDFYVTSGLTLGGGQNISRELGGFRDYVLARLPGWPPQRAEPGARVFVSRKRSKMRRLLNEDALFEDVLKPLGFIRHRLEVYRVSDQLRLMHDAEIVVGAHGAGLTNILTCRPGTKILEIFPEGGLHSSAFMRMATLLGLDYAFFCADAVANTRSVRNSINADIVCDTAKLGAFLAEFLAR